MDSVTQWEHEHRRLTADGRRTEDGDRCTLLVVHERGGAWAFYPHGWGKFGVRLPDEQARRVARAILDGGQRTARTWRWGCDCWTPPSATASSSGASRPARTAPLWGVRETEHRQDTIYLGGLHRVQRHPAPEVLAAGAR